MAQDKEKRKREPRRRRHPLPAVELEVQWVEKIAFLLLAIYHGIWEELKANPRLLPQSSLGKAVSYFLNEYTAVVGYLRDGEFQIDNNLVENDMRPSVVGRKRWLFIGHPDAGWRSAVIYTIIQSCRRRGINLSSSFSLIMVLESMPDGSPPPAARFADERQLMFSSR